MRKKLMALLLCCALALGFCANVTALAELPTEWDLTVIYETPDAWHADYERAVAMIAEEENFRGTLDTAQGVYDYLSFAYLGELTTLWSKLGLYADLGSALDVSDPVFAEMMAKLDQMASYESAVSAFVEPEIYALPLETRQEIFSDPLLADYAYVLRRYVDPDEETLSEETLGVLATLSPAMGRAGRLFEMLNYVDLPYPVITMPDGTEAELTEELYAQIVTSSDYDREFRAKANELSLSRVLPVINTFTAMLEAHMAERWAWAQIEGFENTRAYMLDGSDVEPMIYDLMIAAAHEGVTDYQRYLTAHQKALGLEEQYPFDLSAPVSDFEPGLVTYEEAVAQVEKALAPLGEKYLAIFCEIMDSPSQDVYPAPNKTTGAFSTSYGPAHLPYLLLNFAGTTDDVSTIAHEMGHSIYSYLSERTQDALNNMPTIFTHEVASTVNELIYFRHMMENAATDAEKLYYLDRVLSMFSGAFFTQARYAEFEDYLYQTVETGDVLDAETISDEWMQLLNRYRGDTVKTFPDARYQWAEIPHMYYDYYVYQYATSVCYAAAISQRILSGDEEALDGYLQMLTLGGSMSPAELLNIAGVDPLEEETYDAALNYYRDLVDEYEQLIEAANAG